MFNKIIFFFVVIFIPFLLPLSVSAVEFSISNPINVSDVITVDVAISGLTSQSCLDNKCYLQGAFQKSEGDSHFGFTQNNSNQWYEYVSSPSEDYIKSTFFYFEPTDGVWSGKLLIKNHPESSAYKGPGEYTLKVKRYTGKSTSEAGTSSLPVTLNLSTPTPTPSPSPTPTTSPTQTPTPTSTSTPTPTSTPTLTPTKSPTLKPTTTPSPTETPLEESPESVVLGVQNESPTPSPTVEGQGSKPFPLFMLLIISGGILSIGGIGLSVVRARKKKYNDNNEYPEEIG